MNFGADDVRPAGHVFVIPTSLVPFADRKPGRPFLLLNRCTAGALGNVAPMTTKATEQQYGATLLEFADQRGKLRLPDQVSSYVNFSSLTVVAGSTLKESFRSYARQMPVVRAALKQALGIGTGFGTGAPGESLRGYVVRLADRLMATFGSRLGMVITEHQYSAAWRKQVVVAIDDISAYLARGKTLDDFRPESGEVLPNQGAAWLRQLPAGRTMRIVDAARLMTFSQRWRHGPRPETWLEAQIEHIYPIPVDTDTLAAIESALIARFNLP